ncbi:DUF2384 domain-containing protein [Rhodanobacter ginsengiterrae]|uniref:DUF2384 domain-containing protein n=1 Tax=Rhodanobacter ginsengiterrae TaxID=2008451 RepID=UPI003CFA2167
MRKSTMNFSEVAREIARINAERDQIVQDAFSTLECRHATLAQTLLDNVGNRQRAAYWMCTHQRAFEGRTAYEVLADGDEDQVWERIPGNPDGESMDRPGRPRMAY